MWRGRVRFRDNNNPKHPPLSHQKCLVSIHISLAPIPPVTEPPHFISHFERLGRAVSCVCRSLFGNNRMEKCTSSGDVSHVGSEDPIDSSNVRISLCSSAPGIATFVAPISLSTLTLPFFPFFGNFIYRFVICFNVIPMSVLSRMRHTHHQCCR